MEHTKPSQDKHSLPVCDLSHQPMPGQREERVRSTTSVATLRQKEDGE